TEGERRIVWGCLGGDKESCRYIPSLSVGFCIQGRAKPSSCPSPSPCMEPLPYQEGGQGHEGGRTPRWQAITRQPDEGANKPGGDHHRPINQQAVDAHSPCERCPRGA